MPHPVPCMHVCGLGDMRLGNCMCLCVWVHVHMCVVKQRDREEGIND